MTKNYAKQNYGIYTITNTVNGKTYIGQTAGSFHGRWKGHLKKLMNGKHHNAHLRAAASKYGHEMFRFDAIEAGPQGLTKEERVAWCNNRETYWLGDAYLSEDYYNMKGGGDNAIPGPEIRRKIAKTLTGMKHTEETKRKISEANIGENNPNWGKTHTEETRRKISEAVTGKKHTEETKRKMSETRKGVPKSEEHRQNISKALTGENHPMWGKNHTEEARRKMSEAHKGIPKPKITCPWCGKTGGKPAMSRHHMDNCKHKEA